ncbi:MAG: sensor hybrid histidine kinase [Fibrobacteres bacterium]|nr:sensor hybrid histidine kinase [Fibrobacterota bacterium]
MKQSASSTHESLRQDVNHLQLLVDAVTEYAIYTLDRDGKVATWNTGARRIKGYEAEEILGKPFHLFFPPEAQAAGVPDALLEKAARLGVAKDEGWRVRKDGTRFVAEAVISPIYDKDRTLQGYAKVTRDVTDRHATKELQALNQRLSESEASLRALTGELEASRNRLDVILKGVDISITAQDPSGKLVFANPAGARILGFPSQEALLSTPMSEVTGRFRILDGDGRPFPVEQMPGRVALSGRDAKPVIIRYQETATGSEIWTLVKATPVKDQNGHITMAINFAQDITEIKRKELEERTAKEQFQIILEGISDAISVQDPKGKLLFLNQACAALLGFSSPQEVIDLAADPEKAASVAKRITLLDEGGNPFPPTETPGRLALQGQYPPSMSLRFRMSDEGRERWVISSAKPVFDEKGNLKLVVSILHDVTELKEAEIMLRQSQKMEAVGKLAGGIAHDFNNLLTAINGYSDMILSRLSAFDGDTFEQVTEIRNAGERAASLTQQLLAFSRKQILAPKVINLNDVLSGMDSLLQRLIGENIELLTILQPGIEKIKADPGQIEQVILNLALNSRDAMPEGGKLTMETANVDLDDAYVSTHLESKRGPHVVLAITDTGVGMDAHVKARLFEPFFTTKGPGKGTGLGLATVFGIVKQSGGSLNVYSEPGRGTTFKVYFPAVSGPAPERIDGVARAVPGAEPHGETILIVEDEDSVRKLVQQTLTECGYACLTAADAETALEMVRARKGEIDLLLTDVILPGINGKLLAERLVKDHPGIKVLYMSGYTDNAIVHHGVLDAGTEFINKPFSAQTLKHRVRESLAQGS